ncbi:MAG: right-handed parallel beta-helix repeat-containing protein [Saprospiraceae bacterium]
MKSPFFLLLAAILLATTLSATDYYVSTTGSNANAGTLAAPFATLQHAIWQAGPGTTIFLLSGTYQESVWMEAVNGSPGNFITIRPFGNDVVTLDGGATNTQTVLLTLYNVQYVRIQGLVFKNAMGNFSSAITVRNGSQHIEIIDNLIENIHFSTDPGATVNASTNANPLIVYGDNPSVAITDVKIMGNTVRDCRTGFSEALTVNGNVDGFEVVNNMVNDITNIGIDLAGGYGTSSNPSNDMARNGRVAENIVFNCVSNYAVSAGIYADGSHNIIIENNTVWGCGRGFQIGCEQVGKTAAGILLRNNVAFANEEAGMGIGGYNYPVTGKVINSIVRNNTFYGNVTTNNGDGELLVEYTENCLITQNIFHATNTQAKLLVTRLNSTGLILDYNLYFHTQGAGNIITDWNGDIDNTFASFQVGSGQEAHGVFGDPDFSDPSHGDFHITAISPANNAGNPSFIPDSGEKDLDGEARLQHGTVDIGADESADAPLPVSYLQPLSLTWKNGDVWLSWHTAWVYNAAHFEVQHSRDGQHFLPIGQIGISSNTNHYQFRHASPGKGIHYYRLRQYDHDGLSYWSNIITTVFEAPHELLVYPNPTSSQFSLSVNTSCFITLRDASGTIVLPATYYQPDTSIDIRFLANGAYWLSVDDERGVWLVKQ